MKKTQFILIFALAIVNGLLAQVGIIDPSFTVGTGFGPDQWTGKCQSIIQQPDGKLLVGGQFKTFNGDTTFYISRLNLNGTRDNGFTSQFTDSWGYDVRAIALQNDGKIIIGGEFNQINGVTRNRIARLNSDGTLDLTFNPASGFDQQVNTIYVQPDGKILVGGLFSTYDFVSGGSQTPVSGIARLNADGTLDNTFTIGTGFTGSSGIGQRRIHKIVVQPDGKILVGGHFSRFNGATSILLTRLNADGTLDNTFDANSNFSTDISGFYGQVYDLKLLPNGKIMTSGNYGNTNSLANGIDRLNADGSLDGTFQISHSTDYRCFAFDVQADGKILASAVNFGAPSEAYAVERLNTDGTLDTIFPKKFLNRDVTDLIVQADGKITIVGYFDYNPTGIMRLIGDSPLTSNMGTIKHSEISLYPNPANEFVTIANVPNNSIVKVQDITGKIVYASNSFNEHTIIDVRDFNVGLYFVQIEHNNMVFSKKLLITK